jgi:Protein of unknown function (DUF4232)
MKSAVAVAGALCTFALLSTGCDSSTPGCAPSDSSGSSTSFGSAGSAGSTSPGGPIQTATSSGGGASSAHASSSQCTQAQLTATTGGSAMEGVAVLAIVFTNNSTNACQVSGYPGVAGLDASGNQAAQATRQPGLATPTITLAPGSSVSALVKTAAVNSAPNCEFAGGLAVTPPNTSTTVKLTDPPDKLNTCALTVTPVVSGTNGGDSNIQ